MKWAKEISLGRLLRDKDRPEKIFPGVKRPLHDNFDTNDGNSISVYFCPHVADSSPHSLKYGLPESVKYARGTVYILEECNDCYTLEQLNERINK